jgi:hypothetical protein
MSSSFKSLITCCWGKTFPPITRRIDQFTELATPQSTTSFRGGRTGVKRGHQRLTFWVENAQKPRREDIWIAIIVSASCLTTTKHFSAYSLKLGRATHVEEKRKHHEFCALYISGEARNLWEDSRAHSVHKRICVKRACVPRLAADVSFRVSMPTDPQRQPTRNRAR